MADCTITNLREVEDTAPKQDFWPEF